MANNYSFSVMPSVSISRSRFERKSQHKTSFNLGYIVPIYVDEVLPGDTRSIDMAALVRMSTPIAPIMDNIHLDLFAFFVPNRLVMSQWPEFMGENKTSAGIPATSPSIPTILQKLSSGDEETDIASDLAKYPTSLANYLGIPINAWRCPAAYAGCLPISALPFRGYYLIYNEWFRNQNIIAPLPVSTGSAGGLYPVLVQRSAVDGVSYTNDVDLPLCKASKLPDYFTKALPYAQKGDAVTIPMSLSAPIVGAEKPNHSPLLHNVGTNGYVFGSGVDGTTIISSGDIGIASGSMKTKGSLGSGDETMITGSNLIADLSNVAGTIDQLRYAFQLQKFLWRDSAYGSRYWEILAGHFNIKAPDASLQRPEFLGGSRIEINIDQVLSTAGYSNTSSTTVGAPGANSVTGRKVSLFTKSFTEHGFIFIMAVARHDNTYTNGLNKMWTRQSKFDYYWPEFANLGSQAVLQGEIDYNGANPDAGNSDVFGYQEAWAEYRYKPSIATGLLNPICPNSLIFWTLANDYELGGVALGQHFIEQQRSALSRCLVTGTNGPDFIGDFFFRDIAVRPMPTYSIPGLADHH